MKRWLGFVLGGALLLAPGAQAAYDRSPVERSPERIAKRASVGGVVEAMTLREKIGQLMMFGVSGQSLSGAEHDLIVRHHLGGVILFSHNYADRTQLENLTRQIQAAARSGNGLKAGALISVDQEGGVVKRFPDMPPRYSAPEMGRIGKESVAFDQGRATGRALRAAGVNIDLAPVADLDLPPSHVMQSRSFGDNRYAVARLATSFAQGLQRPNVAAAAKHFPGLGGATQNSDDGPTYVYRSRQELRTIDAIPFKRVIAGGIKMMMIGHAMYVNDGGRKPASLSRYITTKRLRQGLGFKGVAISDALEPVAFRFDGDVVKTCKRTVQAGMDVALLTSGPTVAAQCAQRIYRAVRNGTISKNRIDQAATRVLKLKAWLEIL